MKISIANKVTWLSFPVRYVLLAVLLLCGLLWLVSNSSITSGKILSTIDMKASKAIALPYSARSNAESRWLIYLVTIDHKIYSPVKWRIVVDDCIRGININGQPLDLSTGKGNACDIHSGIRIDLSNHLKKGSNLLEVHAEDYGGGYAFNIIPIPLLPHFFPILEGLDSFFTLLFNGFVSSILILYFCRFLLGGNVDYISIGLFILSAVVSLHYLHISNNNAYTNDIGWHLNYINYVSQNWLTPYNYSSWTSNHPPLYYYIAAATIRLNEAFIGLDYLTALRFLSWVFFLLFHTFNLLILRRAGFTGIGYYACVALLLLWPGNAHLPSKINSEAMYYAMAAISFYYTIIWHQEGTQRHLMKAIIFAGIAFIVRTNAVIIFSIIGSLMLVALFRRSLSIRDFFTKPWMKTAAVFLLLSLISVGGMFFHEDNSMLVGIVRRFAHFPLTHYLSLGHSFADPYFNWSENTGFLEYLLKTSMFGEYSWSFRSLGTALNYLVVAIFWYSVLPWLFASRSELKGMLPYMLYLPISVCFVIYFSVLVGDYASQDVRYIYPSLVCFVVLFGRSQAFYVQRGMWLLGWLGPVLAMGFTILSTYFFWNNFR